MNKIILKQAPIIEYSFLEAEGKKVAEKLEKLKINDLVITEDTVKGIKKVRADLKKEYEEYEAGRKGIKEMVMNPYDDFNKSYEEHIKSKYINADSILKKAIDEVEGGIKQQKQTDVENYFIQQNNNVYHFNFIKFENIGIKVGLSDTLKSLTAKVDEYLEKVKSDLVTIETLDNKDRLLVKYRQTLDLNTSIIQVNNDIKAEKELENARAEQERVKQAEALIQPTVVEPIQEELLQVEFTVTATLNQIKSLKAYMESVGIKYE
ncbi:MAG: DUF1351 domain-containing protein [Longicatena sp.]